MCLDTMNQLLVLAANVDAEPENRVHACNILRALYRDTRLAESVSGFVEAGLRVAIQAEKKYWTVTTLSFRICFAAILLLFL